jgi:hypothetical protein
MSKLDELREDYRLARLNQGDYRPVFFIYDVSRVVGKLALLGLFLSGLWYLTYGYESRPDHPGENMTQWSDKATTLSSERIAMLRQFAEQNRERELSEALASVRDSAKKIASDATLVLVSEAGLAADDPGPMTPAPVVAPLADANIETRISTALDDLQRRLGADDTLSDEASVPALVLAAVVPGAPPVTVEKEAQTAETPEVVSPVLKDAAWVLAQPADQYLIQIGYSSNRPFLVQFEKKLPDTQTSALFEMEVRSQAEHVLTWGRFDSREQAHKALSQLSQTARKYGAYVRSYGVVQSGMLNVGGQLASVQSTSLPDSGITATAQSQ